MSHEQHRRASEKFQNKSNGIKWKQDIYIKLKYLRKTPVFWAAYASTSFKNQSVNYGKNPGDPGEKL